MAENEIKNGRTKNEKVLLAVLAGLVALMLFGIGVGVARFFVAGRLFDRVGEMKSREIYGYGHRKMMDGGGGLAGANVATGKVTSVNDKQFKIDVNGTSKTVQITDATRFPLNSATAVKVDDKVVVRGAQDSNGVIQAVMITVNPSF